MTSWPPPRRDGCPAIIVGAPRSATTSLFSALSKHPQIAPCALKEPSFYLVDAQGHRPNWFAAHVRDAPPRTLAEYQKLFGNPRGRVTLEASPAYWVDPEAPRRIVAVNDHVRLIVVLRQPVDMLWSGYRTIFPAGSPEAFVRQLESDARWPGDPAPLVELGFHARHLRRYREAIAARPDADVRMHFVLFENLTGPLWLDAIEGICDFLEIDRRPLELGHMNAAGAAKSAIVGRIGEAARVKQALKRWLPSGLLARLVSAHHKVRSANLRAVRPLPADLRAEVTERYFAADVEDLTGLTGLDLSHWRGHRTQQTP